MPSSIQPLHVMLVFGTRPEAVKLAPVNCALRRRHVEFKVTIVVTGQHREMLHQFLEFFQMAPDVDLDIMEDAQTLPQVTSRAISGLDGVLSQHKPNIVLVQGDTATVLAATLTAFYHGIQVAHVEAGLRTRNKHEPFPEEILRQMTSVIADLHFAPTEHARSNLLREGVDPKSIFVVGNTVVDALQSVQPRLDSNDTRDGRMLLVTAHRRENIGKPMKDICKAIRQIVDRFNDVRVVFPVHKNPAVRQVVFSALSGHDRIELLEPTDYLSFLALMKQSFLILSDSGGVQEEAPVFGKPVLVLRRTTERPEGIHAGVASLVGTDSDSIVRVATELLESPAQYASMSRGINPYGDGRASERIAQALLQHFGIGSESPDEFRPVIPENTS